VYVFYDPSSPYEPERPSHQRTYASCAFKYGASAPSASTGTRASKHEAPLHQRAPAPVHPSMNHRSSSEHRHQAHPSMEHHSISEYRRRLGCVGLSKYVQCGFYTCMYRYTLTCRYIYIHIHAYIYIYTIYMYKYIYHIYISYIYIYICLVMFVTKRDRWESTSQQASNV
jgi:hypothetical protein